MKKDLDPTSRSLIEIRVAKQRQAHMFPTSSSFFIFLISSKVLLKRHRGDDATMYKREKIKEKVKEKKDPTHFVLAMNERAPTVLN